MFWHWVLVYLCISVAISGIYTVLFVTAGHIRNTTFNIWGTFFFGVIFWPARIVIDLSCCAADMLFGVDDDDDDVAY